jgi:hypothetical protein
MRMTCSPCAWRSSMSTLMTPDELTLQARSELSHFLAEFSSTVISLCRVPGESFGSWRFSLPYAAHKVRYEPVTALVLVQRRRAIHSRSGHRTIPLAGIADLCTEAHVCGVPETWHVCRFDARLGCRGRPRRLVRLVMADTILTRLVRRRFRTDHPAKSSRVLPSSGVSPMVEYDCRRDLPFSNAGRSRPRELGRIPG